MSPDKPSVHVGRIGASEPDVMAEPVNDNDRHGRYGQILTGVASRLLASGDRHQTLARLVEVVVPSMCDWAMFSVRDERTGLLRTVELRHRDPEKAILAQTAEKRFPPRADAERGPGLACSTGRSQLDAQVSEELLRSIAQGEEHLQLLFAVGAESFMSVPLVSEDRVVGVLRLGMGDYGRHFGSEDVALAEAVARIAVAALESDGLREAERIARRDAELRSERLGALARITAEVLRHPTLDGLLVALLEGLQGALDTDFASIMLVEDDGVRLRLRASVGLSEAARANRLVPLGDGVAGKIAETRESLIVDDIAATDPVSPLLGEGMTSVVGAPLFSDGALLGVINAGTRDRRSFSPEDRAMLELLAAPAASAIQRARLYESESLARREADMERRRADFLSEASARMAASLDYRETIDAVAACTIPMLADWCDVDMLHTSRHNTAEQKLARFSRAGDPPSQGKEGGDAGDFPTARTNRDGSVVSEHAVQVIGTGQTLLLSGDPSLPDGVSSMLVVPILARGVVIGVISLYMAASGRTHGDGDRLLAEELARRAATSISQARLYREAQKANSAKAEFLATISHELRTPLNAIIGYAELIGSGISGPLTESQRHQLSRLQVSAQHLLQLIDEVLSFATSEVDREGIQITSVDMSHILGDVLDRFRSQMETRGLTLEFQMDRRMPAVHTDVARLRQILLNVVSNAVKFTSNGSVSVAARHVDSLVEVSVSDTGIGIDSAHLASIFEPFWQVEQTRTRRVGGTGLGLSVARRNAELLGGVLQVRSKPGKGSTFVLRIPISVEASG